MTTIEILGAGPRPEPPSPLNGRAVALTITLLLASGGLLAMFAGPEGTTPSPANPLEASPTDPPIEVIDLTSNTAMELPPKGATFDVAFGTPNGIELRTLNDPGATISMAGPPTRLAFGFDGPVIVHQAGDAAGPSPNEPLIRITTPELTRILPTGDQANLVLLDATVLAGRPIVLWAGTVADGTVHLHVFDLETAATADLGAVGGAAAHLERATFDGELVAVSYTEGTTLTTERWDLGGTVLTSSEEPVA